MRCRLAGVAVLLLALSIPLHASPLRPPAELQSLVDGMTRGQCGGELAALETLATRSDPTGARAEYLFAHCLQEVGRRRDAQIAFDAAAVRHPSLAAYARVRAAELALMLGDPGGALRRIVSIPGMTPSLIRRSRMVQAEALVRTSRYFEAEQVSRQLVSQLSDRRDLAKAWWWRARAADARGARGDAAYHYAMVAWGFQESDLAAPAAQRLRLIGRALHPPATARLQRARWLMARGRPQSAERELAIAVRGRLAPADEADAWYRLGILRFPSRRRLAARAFLTGARLPHQADRSLYWASRALISGGRSSDGYAIWRRLIHTHPTSPWAARASFGMGLAAETAQVLATADAFYADVARRFPQSVQGQEAAWRRGWWRYRIGKFAEAEAVFLNAAHLHPESLRASAALYWGAMARVRRGADGTGLLAEAAEKYPLGYYGQQARRRLGMPAPILPATVVMPELPADRFAAAGEELGALGFHREATEHALQAAPSLQSARFLADHRAQAGEVSASVQVAEVALAAQRGRVQLPDRALLELAYPAAYPEAVTTAAQATGVDRYLILAVIREESRFDPTAVSFAGATGLMQLLPSTARHLITGRVATAAGLMQPDINVRYGAIYLQRLLARFGGDVVLALAAYNAGSGNAVRFARARPRIDEPAFIEQMPIEETRTYVRRVIESYGIYHWLYR